MGKEPVRPGDGKSVTVSGHVFQAARWHPMWTPKKQRNLMSLLSGPGDRRLQRRCYMPRNLVKQATQSVWRELNRTSVN